MRAPAKYTSEWVLETDITLVADIIATWDSTHYLITADEVAALNWLSGRYSVVDVLLDAIEEQEDGSHVLIVNAWDIACALGGEGLDRVPCLDESTALARIVWCIGPLT